jgi:hypothetical protein
MPLCNLILFVITTLSYIAGQLWLLISVVLYSNGHPEMRLSLNIFWLKTDLFIRGITISQFVLASGIALANLCFIYWLVPRK